MHRFLYLHRMLILLPFPLIFLSHILSCNMQDFVSFPFKIIKLRCPKRPSLRETDGQKALCAPPPHQSLDAFSNLGGLFTVSAARSKNDLLYAFTCSVWVSLRRKQTKFCVTLNPTSNPRKNPTAFWILLHPTKSAGLVFEPPCFYRVKCFLQFWHRRPQEKHAILFRAFADGQFVYILIT